MPLPSPMPPLIPYFAVRDAKKAIEFYKQAFGFELCEEPSAQDGVISHVEMRFGNAVVMFSQEGAFGSNTKAPITLGVSSPVGFMLRCPDVDALYKQALQAGATSQMEPADMFWGERFCKVADPDGHEWGFGQPIQNHD